MKNTRCKIHRRVVSLLLALAIIFGGMNIPKSVNAAWGGPYWYKSQNDYKTVFKYKGIDKTVDECGCSHTCIAMAIYKLMGYDISPETLFKDSIDKNYYKGDGLDHPDVVRLCNDYGLSCIWKSYKDKDTIIKALKDGKMVIFNVQSDDKHHFAPDPKDPSKGPGGHYVILSGYDYKTGKFTVYDPCTHEQRNHKRRIGVMESWDTLKYVQKAGYDQDFLIVSKGTLNEPTLDYIKLDNDPITQGNACNISGEVISRTMITSVKTEILGTDIKASDTPNKSRFEIKYTDANKNLSFGKLSVGSYTLRITVVDVLGRSRSRDIPFSVKTTKATPQIYKFVDRLYVNCLGRSADAEGRKYWSLALANGDKKIKETVLYFFTSDEFVGFKLSNDEFLNRLYKTLFNREPDGPGKAYWLKRLKTDSRKKVVQCFMEEQEFRNLCNSLGVKWE